MTMSTSTTTSYSSDHHYNHRYRHVTARYHSLSAVAVLVLLSLYVLSLGTLLPSVVAQDSGESESITEAMEATETTVDLTIGVVHPQTGAWADFGKIIVSASELWLKYVQSNSMAFAGVDVNVDVIFEDDQTDATQVGPAVERLVERGADVVINDVAYLCKPGAAAGERLKVPVVGGLCGTLSTFQCPVSGELPDECDGVSNARMFEYGTTLIVPTDYYFMPFINMVAVKHAKSIVFVSIASPPYSASLGEVIQNHIKSKDMAILGNLFLSGAAATVEDCDAVVIDLRDNLQPDALVLATDSPSCINFVKSMKKNDYTPKAMSAFACVDFSGAVTELGDSLRYITGPSQWTPTATGNKFIIEDSTPSHFMKPTTEEEGESLSAAMKFAREYEALTGKVPGYQEASLASAFVAIEAAVARVKTSDSKKLNVAINSLFEPSFYGLLNTNEHGINLQKGMFLLQRSASNELGVVAPLESSDMSFVYPMPSWAEREYVPPGAEVYTAPAWLLVSNIVLAIANIVYCFITAAIMMRHRKAPVVQAASLKFALLILAGAVLGSIGGLFLVMEPTDGNNVCDARLWVTALGAVWVVGPLLARTWRLSRIFNNRRTQIPKFTSDKALFFVWVLPLTLLVVVSIGISHIVPDSREVATAQLLEERELPFNFVQPIYMNVCLAKKSAASRTLSAFLLVVGLVCMVFTNQHATKVKGSPRAFNESSEISHCSLLMLVITFFLVLVDITTDDSRTTQIIISLGVQVVFITVSVSIFMVKLLAIRKTAQGGDAASKAGSGAGSGYIDSNKESMNTQEMNRRLNEGRMLREKLEEFSTDAVAAIDAALDKQFGVSSRRQSFVAAGSKRGSSAASGTNSVTTTATPSADTSRNMPAAAAASAPDEAICLNATSSGGAAAMV